MPQQRKKNADPVVFEKYNEITFYEPTEKFMKTLQNNTLDNYLRQQNEYYESVDL